MSHVTDARDIIFADPADMETVSDVSALSLDDQIEYAEWQVEVAIANRNACVGDADIDRAAFDLKCAISLVNDLCQKREARDREIQRQHTDCCALEFGRLAIESDKHDKAITAGGFSHG